MSTSPDPGAVCAPSTDAAYDPLDFVGRYGYWAVIEAALTSLPETSKLRAPALASFDHLKERITEGRDAI